MKIFFNDNYFIRIKHLTSSIDKSQKVSKEYVLKFLFWFYSFPSKSKLKKNAGQSETNAMCTFGDKWNKSRSSWTDGCTCVISAYTLPPFTSPQVILVCVQS